MKTEEMSEFCSRTGGYVSAILMQIFGAASALCSQALQDLVPPLQLNCLRFLCQLLFSILILILQKGTIKANSGMVPFILIGGFLSNAANISFYTATALLPLGTLMSVDWFSTLLTSAILDKIIFNKTINLLKVFLLLAVFLGLVLLIGPEYIPGANILSFNITDKQTFISNVTLNGTASSTLESGILFLKGTLGLVLSAVAGIVGALRAALNRRYLCDIPTITLTFWLSVLGVYPSLVFMFYFEEIAVQFSKGQVLLFISHACLAGAGSILKTFSQQKISPLAWAMIACFEMVIVFILQFTLMKDIVPVKGNLQEFAGALIILFSVVTYAIIDIKKEEDQRNSI